MLNPATVDTGSEFISESSFDENTMISNSTMNEQPYDFEKGMGEEGEPMIVDDEAEVRHDGNEEYQGDKDSIEKAQTGKESEDVKTTETVKPQVNEEYTKIKSEYEKLQKDMTEIQEFFKREEVRKVLEPIVRGQQQQVQQPTQPAAPDPSISLDLDSFSDAEKESPIAFMNAFGKRATAAIDKRASEIASTQINAALSKMLDVFEPIIKDYRTNKQEAVKTELKTKYPEDAPVYLDKNTPQYAALLAEVQADPNLTLEKAFLIARGKFAGQDAKKQADLIVKNREKMGIPSTSGKVQVNKVKQYKSSRDAALAAFESAGN